MFPVKASEVNLIGIHGPLDGGKDTVANWLQAVFPNRFNRYAFAKPLKQACVTLFGFTQEQMEDRILKEKVDEFWGFTPRKAMQLLGTEFGRGMLREDVWIRRGEMEYQKNMALGHGTIITDVRFENEAEWVRSTPNSLIIYLDVPNLKKDERYQHASEAGIALDKSRDAYIVNDKTLGLDNLFTRLSAVIK